MTDDKIDNTEWKSILGFEGLYEVSDKGLIRGLDRYANTHNGKRFVEGKIIKTYTTKKGYVSVRLNKEDKARTYNVHRLVAIAFLQNEENLPQVNHKNGCKSCNEVGNLEWTDAKGNIQHAFENGLNDNCGCNHVKAIVIMDTETGELYCTFKTLAEHLGFDYSALRQAINGIRPYPKTWNIDPQRYQRYSC